MRFDLQELLAASISSSPSTPAMTPTRSRGRTWKIYQKRRRLPEWTGQQPSPSKRPDHTHNRSITPEQEDYFEQNHDSNSEVSTPSKRRDGHDPFWEDHNRRPPPSTPRRPGPRPGRSTPWSTKSAPAHLFPSLARGRKSPSEDVDDIIIKELKSALPKTQLEGCGDVYLLEVVPADDLDRIIMKIGSTAKTGQERMKEISSQCKHYSMKREVVPEGWLIPNYKRAERLIQAHLRDRLSAFACGCRKPHREYFDVETATALEVMRFWTAFCESNPYDAAGKLRPFWKYRLRQRKKLPYWGHQAPEGLSELESRRRRWEVFANPTRIEIYWFHAMVAWSKYWPWKVHLFAVFEAYVIVYLVLPKLYFFLVLSLTIAIWALW